MNRGWSGWDGSELAQFVEFVAVTWTWADGIVKGRELRLEHSGAVNGRAWEERLLTKDFL